MYAVVDLAGFMPARMKGYDPYKYIDVNFNDKFQVEIQYKVLDNEENNVHIIDITTEF